MPLSGGGAAKAGNRFECRWTVSVLLDVLEGTAQSLYLEVPGPDAIGTEFRAMVDGVAVWHQAKRQLSEGPWNVARLARKGQLASWWDKVRRGDRFVFVSRTSPDDLEELAERARDAESWAVYREHFLGKARRGAFDEVRRCWGDPPEEAVYHGLRNIEVQVVNEKRLVDENQRRIASLIIGNPVLTAARLEQLVNDSVHRLLTAETTWDMLADLGLEPAPPPGSTTFVGPAAGAADAPPLRWQPGAVIDVGRASYMLHDHLLAEEPTPGGSVIRRARALRVDPGAPRNGRYVWIREVELRQGSPDGRKQIEAMGRERRLLEQLGDVRGLPKLMKAVVDSQRATVVLRWPASRNGSRPCDSLGSLLGAPVDDRWRLSRLLSGFADLTLVLGRLHQRSASHRDLVPEAIVLLDDGGLVLRDLGLAAHAPRAGEPTSGDPAPEQRGLGRTLPGPPTDVYRLAALLYRLLAGHPPHPLSPLPFAGAAPALPAAIAQVLDAALWPEPGDRPPLRDLGAALRSGSKGLA